MHVTRAAIVFGLLAACSGCGTGSKAAGPDPTAFGGCNGGVACTELNDTWEWDGTNRTQVSPSTSPAARNGHEMVYDSARGVAVLFGGWSTATSTEFNDTWEWNGTNWVQATPATSPAARDYTAMIYDSTQNVTVLFGGRNNGNHTYYADTWQWDGTNWTQLMPPTSPTLRGLGSAAFDTSLSDGPFRRDEHRGLAQRDVAVERNELGAAVVHDESYRPLGFRDDLRRGARHRRDVRREREGWLEGGAVQRGRPRAGRGLRAAAHRREAPVPTNRFP